MLKFLWSGAHTAMTMTGLPTSDIVERGRGAAKFRKYKEA